MYELLIAALSFAAGSAVTLAYVLLGVALQRRLEKRLPLMPAPPGQDDLDGGPDPWADEDEEFPPPPGWRL